MTVVTVRDGAGRVIGDYDSNTGLPVRPPPDWPAPDQVLAHAASINQPKEIPMSEATIERQYTETVDRDEPSPAAGLPHAIARLAEQVNDEFDSVLDRLVKALDRVLRPTDGVRAQAIAKEPAQPAEHTGNLRTISETMDCRLDRLRDLIDRIDA